MQRTKQQALMFLLGAVLVGGALGFSADRYIGHEKFASQYGPRGKFYDEIGLSTSAAQHARLARVPAGLRDASRCSRRRSPCSIRSRRASRRSGDSVFTKEQLAKLDSRQQRNAGPA